MKKLLTAVVILLALVGVLLLSLPTILHKAGLHPEYNGPTVALPGKRALIITTSHGVLAAPGETEGPATGVAAKVSESYYDDKAAMIGGVCHGVLGLETAHTMMRILSERD